MTFTQIPQQYAPLGGELRYTVTAAAAGTIDLRITDTGSADLIGARRFAGSASVSFDAAPCLRRAIRFSPVTGSTGFHVAEGRCIAAVVEAGMTPAGETDPANGEKAVSPERTFLPRRNIVAAPALLTAMPSVRTISPGESDELTLLCDEACTITVTAQAGDSATAESYRTKSGGVLVFRLDTRDFPDAETLTVDAGKCGSVSYTVVPTVSGGRRLAWRSSAGSIEHYTFPIEKSVTAETVKDRAYGPTATSRRRPGTERRDHARIGLRDAGRTRSPRRDHGFARSMAGGGRGIYAGRRNDPSRRRTPPRGGELSRNRNPLQAQNPHAMELNIDGKPCDLGSERIAVPGYAAAALADVEAAREGRSLTLTIPATMRNDALAGFARDPHTAERFNATLHTAELTAEGSVMLSGTVRMLSASDEGYRIEIRDGGAGWAKNAARRMFNALGVDFRAALTPETILAGLDGRFAREVLPDPPRRIPAAQQPTDLLPAQRLLTVDDYHPFLACGDARRNDLRAKRGTASKADSWSRSCSGRST